MEISLNGQSAFLVKSTSGAFICDPSNDEEAKFVPSSAADDTVITALLFSSPASSSFRRTSDSNGVESISHPGEYEIGDLGLRGIALPAELGTESKKTVTSFCINAEGLAIYMLGLPQSLPDSRTLQRIGHVDLLLLDIARLQMDIRELSSIIGSLEPSYVFVNGLESDGSSPGQRLTSLLGETSGGQMRKEPQLRVSVTRNSLPADRQLIVLRPRVQA